MSEGAYENIVVRYWMVALTVPLLIAWYAYNREASGDLEYFLSYWYGGLPGMYLYRSYKETNDRSEIHQCTNCYVAYDGAPDFCFQCGESMAAVDARKSVSIIQSGRDRFCSNCKAKLDVENPNRCDSWGGAFVSDVIEIPEVDEPTTSLVQSGQQVFCRYCKSQVDSEAARCDGCGRVIE